MCGIFDTHPWQPRKYVRNTHRHPQAASIAEGNLFMTEAFIHALADLKGVTIVTFSPGYFGPHKRLVPFEFPPGFYPKGQVMISLQRVQELMRSTEPVYFFSLKDHHYSCLRVASSPSRNQNEGISLLSPPESPACSTNAEEVEAVPFGLDGTPSKRTRRGCLQGKGVIVLD